MQLYTYYRSTTSYRVRIALNLKGCSVKSHFVNLRQRQQFSDAFRALNPLARVPVLITDEGQVLTQSMAILEYLDEKYSEPPLLPGSPTDRAQIRAMAHMIACDIHPIDNLIVLNYLRDSLHVNESGRLHWYRHWIRVGFEALERILEAAVEPKQFCVGDKPSLADVCLVPQVYNARRFELDLTPYPNICRVEAACMTLGAFQEAAPERQPDAPAAA